MTDQFDLAAYSSNYEGYTKLARLQFIMGNVPELRTSALKMLLQELKGTSNMTLYKSVFKSLDLSDGQQSFDEEWVRNTEKRLNTKLEALEAELNSAKSTMVKESIRIAHNDIANLQYQAGNLNESLKSFIRTRDFCSMPRHNHEMCLNVIGVAIDMNQYFNASNYLGKLADGTGDAIINGKVKAASGLVALHDGLYKMAALRFIEVDVELGNNYRSTISAEDIAIYGVLCSLATFDRNTLRQSLIEKKTFVNNYAVLVPAVRALVFDFYNGKYGECLKTLHLLRPRLAIDMHLRSCHTALYDMIHDRMILQYIAPYSVIDLNRMAAAFGLQEEELELHISRLIIEDKVSAKIDAKAKVLYRKSQDSRNAMVSKVVALSDMHAKHAKRDLLRLSLLQHGFVVEPDGSMMGGGKNPRGMHPSEAGPEGFRGMMMDDEALAYAYATDNAMMGSGAGQAMMTAQAVEGLDEPQDDHEDYDST